MKRSREAEGAEPVAPQPLHQDPGDDDAEQQSEEVPSRATMTASQRTEERTWPRSMPTARSRPSSRVLSWIDNESVLAMPITAMITMRASKP